MEYLCTACSKRKRRHPALLPAIERYLSRRIRLVAAESRRRGRPFLVLSGRYGVLVPTRKIPWYDQLLRPADVAALASRVVRQLRGLRASSVVFYGRPRRIAGWGPYYEVLERACCTAGIPLRFKRVRSDLC